METTTTAVPEHAQVEDSTVIFGIGGPLVIGLGAILLGIPLMLICRYKFPEFFNRKREVADPALLETMMGGHGS